ncbi:hypothetical protein E0H26_19770 [Micromonospora zingiberis]|uniref:Uncharacterized protein n=1 Tax=Micromonospora zingiberis TaxID=2053011 RepID=A0A4R0GDX9_9ACTN|nr:hypothetical protein [Micromonospora zingiberis]TCB95434.1 hypothetical protein E0H26_19770 [Micromonospora zingiberis]
MVEAAAVSSDQLGAYHRLLLRLSGRMPDELITICRRWLAEGEFAEIAQAVHFAALVNGVAMSQEDITLLSGTLAAAGEDPMWLADIDQPDTELPPPYGLAPVNPEELAEHGDAVPYCIDLTVPYDGPGAADEIDRAAATAVAAQRDDGLAATALWRAWRFPSVQASWPPPRRVYLLQGGNAALLPALAARMQDALEAAGESDPQVETFLDPDELPTYQRIALGFSALLWAAAPPTPLFVARLYDALDPENRPGFAPDHPLLEDEERGKVFSYLTGSAPLLITSTCGPDVLDPASGEVVPNGFVTDGRWIWADAVAFYLSGYGLAPDPDLLAAIRANHYLPPKVDVVLLHRALSVLYAPVVDLGVDDPVESVGSGLETAHVPT